jgi:hypothetical protein
VTAHDLVLSEALLEGHRYRECQLVSLPSWRAPSAVYMVPGETGSVTVVSRTVWYQRRSSRSTGLKKMRASVATHTAELDGPTARMLAVLCRDVLLRARYPDKSYIGFDGTTFHAGHQLPGAFLTGKTWSPKPSTLAGEFVEMELALQAFAESAPEQREAARADLKAKAEHVAARLKGTATSTPANPALQPAAAEPAAAER